MEPLFIVSPLNRSGTNFLANLILETGEFQMPKGINEDYFSVYSDNLTRYVDSTIKHWSKPFSDPKSKEKDEILAEFGDVLLNRAKKKCVNEKRLLLKCPRPNNIENVFKLFPTAKVLFCIRNGKSTVDSFEKSFNHYTFKDIVDLWAKGCREIDKCVSRYPNAGNVLVINYEDIVRAEHSTIEKINSFCNLTKGLSKDSIENLPIFGSSTNKNDENKLHWSPVKKTSNFDPLSRGNDWGWTKRMLYNYYTRSLNTENK
ncbi:hypothetical protein AWH61_10135 [Alteromonas sp. W12]|uniref:sulfotransferase n=1 Tax=Alteromonas sp. W12 TaxID=1772289 RepID=UPI000948974C|nr:sulfotransferase [Alteromonas sp. W12]OLF77263.1 hypothetical protein AWH61_10135 [Alteromonas sp. W12]